MLPTVHTSRAAKFSVAVNSNDATSILSSEANRVEGSLLNPLSVRLTHPGLKEHSCDVLRGLIALGKTVGRYIRSTQYILHRTKYTNLQKKIVTHKIYKLNVLASGALCKCKINI
jgi:hypothetical protein